MSRPAKLSKEDVEAIRSSSKTQKELAFDFDVSVLTIHKVKAHKGAYAYGDSPDQE